MQEINQPTASQMNESIAKKLSTWTVDRLHEEENPNDEIVKALYHLAYQIGLMATDMADIRRQLRVMSAKGNPAIKH